MACVDDAEAYDFTTTAHEIGMDVLIEVHHCGIDRTDLKLIEGFGYKPNLPFIMGHEISGKVIDIGKDV